LEELPMPELEPDRTELELPDREAMELTALETAAEREPPEDRELTCSRNMG